MEKTLFLYDSYGVDGSPFFFEKEGNYSHLDWVYINGDHPPEHTEELTEILYGKGGFDNGQDISVDKLNEPTRDWTYFVRVGWL